jgi:hypothetical protein
MKADAASAVLETMGRSGKDQAKHAAVLTEKLHQVLPPAVATKP